MRALVRGMLVGVIGLCAGGAHAGPDWMEGSGPTGEAASLPGGANQPLGGGGLTTISGTLSGAPGPIALRGVGDFEDVYRIVITDPLVFRARTDGGDLDNISFAGFDSALYLFDAQGLGVVANKNTSDPLAPDTQGALLLPQASDPPMAAIPSPGVYFLAITGEGATALSLGGTQPIFQFLAPQETSSPDGPGGPAPLDAWDTGFETGDYLIHLQGAAFFECLADLNYDGQVNASDLAQLLGAWGPTTSVADLDFDGFVGPNDLAQLLGAWGLCGP